MSFEFTEFLVQNILYYCTFDTKFLRIVRPQVGPEDLPGEMSQAFLKVIYNFYDTSVGKEAPKELIFDEINYVTEKGIIALAYKDHLVRYAESFKEFGPYDRDQILEKIDPYVQSRNYLLALSELRNFANKRDIDSCRKIVTELLKASTNSYDLGMDFFSEESFKERGERYEERPEYLMPICIEPFDKLGGRFERCSLSIIMAPEKVGKTWAGVFWGTWAVFYGLKVLHITHESGVTKWKLAERYEMAFAGAGDSYKERKWKHITPVLERHKDYFDIGKKEIDVYGLKNRGKILNHIKAARERGGDLIIKEYPRNSCTMSNLELLIDRLEQVKSWVPDVIINDYPDIMKLQSGEYRHAIDNIYQQHSKMSSERNCHVMVFSQVSKKAYNKKRITMADFAEDKRKAAHCDLAFAICQTEDEREQGQIRLVCVLSRNLDTLIGKQVGMVQDLSIGQFCKEAYVLKKLDPGEESEEEE